MSTQPVLDDLEWRWRRFSRGGPGQRRKETEAVMGGEGVEEGVPSEADHVEEAEPESPVGVEASVGTFGDAFSLMASRIHEPTKESIAFGRG